MSKILAQIAGKIVTILGYDGTAFRNILVDELGRLELADMGFRVGLHASTHEDAGDDEINVEGLSGDLADEQDPKDHAGNHEYLGDDEMSLASLGGAIAHIEFVIDGGGAAIAAGEKGHIEIPWPCTLGGVCLFADQDGNIVIDIWMDSVGNFPPTNADTITSLTPPTLTAADYVSDTTLTGWTTTLPARQILAFNVDSCTTIERVTVSMRVAKRAG